MSSNSLFDNLPQNIREIVETMSNDERHLGQTDTDKKAVSDWVTKASDASFASAETLPTFNTELVSRTYLVGNSLTVADVAIYGALHPIISKLTPDRYYSVPSVTRYFDHIQNNASIRSNAAAPDLVSFDFGNAPKQERKAEAPVKKKKEKKEAADTEATEVASSSAKGKAPVRKAEEAASTEQAPANTSGKKEKKEKTKKEATSTAEGSKKGESSKATAGAGTAESGDPIPSMIDLRVGHIVDVKVHPDADSLYVEQIDLGEEGGPRTVISGLVNYVPIEQMKDRYIVAVCNLKPVTMRGIKSHAMVLCATSKEGKEGGVEPVDPPAGAKVGDRIYFEGFEDKEPLSQLNPKKKIFETIQPGFVTLETREAAWVDPVSKTIHYIRTKEGICSAPTFVGASLS
ncbi:G4 quadruplex nucleic acid binding protein [Serendipita sp. 396]|nr:G4 quadruplex nucleic acid binding protein [Serendipita sp. 396]KAG8789288.1 G4 quadruplex nucleic acid binding protein [Serendipita sp. 397]KAG8804509.1 G4 quadruplex nucleic acid binding protein [Serendipita sp. 398]KAG8878467.1 G4 quadruplex nucleic acid binding protein [Serendipita sp. 405]